MYGYGTVLFYVDSEAVDALVAQFPFYAEKFALWSQHSLRDAPVCAMGGAGSEGLGASLQHYNPLIDDAVKQRWSVPESWRWWRRCHLAGPVSALPRRTFFLLHRACWCTVTRAGHMRTVKSVFGIFVALLVIWVVLGLLLRLVAALFIVVALLLAAGVVISAISGREA